MKRTKTEDYNQYVHLHTVCFSYWTSHAKQCRVVARYCRRYGMTGYWYRGDNRWIATCRRGMEKWN